MRKTIITSLALLASLCASGQKIRVVNEIVSWEPIEKNLGADWAEIDSLVVLSTVYNNTAYDFIRKCCIDGRLSGLNLRKVITPDIPASAFALTSSEKESGKANHLKYVTLPAGLEEIGAGAFEGTDLACIDIPRTVVSVGPRAFASCVHLRKVVLRGNVPMTGVSPDAFSGSSSNAVLTVAPSASNFYRQSEAWQGFKRIDADNDVYRERTLSFGGTGSAKDVLGTDSSFVDSLTITGTPSFEDLQFLGRIATKSNGRLYGIDMRGCNLDSLPDESFCGSICRIKYLRLPATLKKTGWSCCAYSYIKWIELPATLEEIDCHAFAFCNYLSMDLVIPEGVKIIGWEGICYCPRLKSVHLPSTLEKLGEKAFYAHDYFCDLNKIYINRTTPPVTVDNDDNPNDQNLNSGPFSDPDKMTLYVPVGARAAYEAHPHWKHFGEIVETPELTGGPNAVEGVTAPDNGNNVSEVYTLSGRLVWRGSGTPSLQKGLYIMKENGRAVKRIVE